MLQNAVANGVRIDIVNPMVFDYYDRADDSTWATSAITAVQGLHAQLADALPVEDERRSSGRWRARRS